MNSLHSFGCSFSYHINIPEDKPYPVLLSKYLKLDHQQYAFPALCNDEIFSRLISNIDKFKKGDVITYQFTFPTRKGFLVDYSNYESSAGFLDDTLISKETVKKNLFANPSLIDLLVSNAEYSEMFLYHTVQRAVKLLLYLKENVGISFRLLFINNDFQKLVTKMNEPKKILRVDKPDYDVTDRFFLSFKDEIVLMDNSSIGLHDYMSANNLTVSASDNHPNVQGHNHIFEQIVLSL